MATKEIIEKDIKKEIIKAYSNNLLKGKQKFNSVFELCESIEIEESEFYQHFSSLDLIEAEMIKDLIDSSLLVLKNSDEFETYDTKNKLLSFYFTFFETLTLNRSLVLKLMHTKCSKIEQYKKVEGFKPSFIQFINELNINFTDFSSDNLQKVQEKTIEISAWSQFLLILKFWVDDTSKGFEKTDIFIEKSIHTSFNLLQSNTLNSIVDLGKFIWKEKVLKMKA